MKGLIVQHRTYGYGKVMATAAAGILIRFCGSGQAVNFGDRAFRSGDIKHARLPADLPALGPDGECVITAVPLPTTPVDSEFFYGIRYQNGLTARVSELELIPLAAVGSISAISQLSSFAPSGLKKLVVREKFIDALTIMSSQAGGLRALLASRIELHPHQAYVAGTIILDPRRRYILADEVGLGKTIEAGVAIHDLLIQKPKARILILTPGALARQWLCELHSSFGGQGFRLLDLHSPDGVNLTDWTRVICSLPAALKSFLKDLENQRWDMVVVDEVHHLLGSQVLYGFVKDLADHAHDLLLLSALPARSNENEFLKLLQILEPNRYQPGQFVYERFGALFEQQALISRRLGRLRSEVRSFVEGDATAEEVLELVDNLLSVAILKEDAQLLDLARKAREEPERLADSCEALCSDVLDRFRINRRILRNRRTRLVEDHLLSPVRRSVETHEYVPGQLEIDTHEAITALLGHAREAGCPVAILRALTAALLEHLASPSLLSEVLTRLKTAKSATLPPKALELVSLSDSSGYDAWDLIHDLICAGARGYLPTQAIDDCIAAANAWKRSAEMPDRIARLCQLLDSFRARREKVIVFAGLRGLADSAAGILEKRYGETEMARFLYSLSDDEKEDNVRRFRQEERRWLLVSDETGGEGRNFQFASTVVHLDLPWSVSVIEQRIGRLDRIGRERDVPSHVVLNSAAPEAGWFVCLNDGFGVFAQSISGIEFGLRSQQEQLLDAAIDGVDVLTSHVAAVAEASSQQRAQDEVNALVDEASMRGASSARFLRPPIPGVDAMTEDGFIAFFRSIASMGSAKRYSDLRTPTGLWKVRPDEVRNVTLEGLDAGEGGLLREHLGTFDRGVARSRRDAEFFAFGNRLFDSVVNVATARAIGRSYAIHVAGTGLGAAELLEFQVFAEPKLELVAHDIGLTNRARLVVDRRRVSVLLRADTLEPIADPTYLAVAEKIRKGEQGASDLPPVGIAAFASRLDREWGAHLQAATAVAREVGRTLLGLRLATEIEIQLQLINEQRRRSVLVVGEGDPEVMGLDALASGIRQWAARIDTIGLLVIS